MTPPMPSLDAVVLAGGERTDTGIDPGAGEEQRYEALLEIGGRPMVEYVVAALRGSPRIGRVVVVGPAEALRARVAPLGFEAVEGGETMVESLLNGIKHLGEAGRVLVATADIPLLTPQAIDDFIDRCQLLEADIYYPIVSKDTNDSLYPGVRRTYVRLRDGTFTGGNVVLLEPGVVREIQALIEWAVRVRKKPWQLSRLLGPWFVVRFLTKQLSLAEIEERVKQTLGLRGAAVVSPYPEIGIDVDKASDLLLVREALAGRAGRGPG